jgi:RNA polymerase sigma factor (sigma-70 family)
MTEPVRHRDASDYALLSHASEDPEAFAEFYRRHFTQVMRYLYARSASPELAADLTSETFVAAYLSRRKFRDKDAGAAPWLLGIARHKLARTARRGRVEARARRRLGVERVPLDEESQNRIEELVDFEPLREEVRAAMQTLTPALAEAVYLRVGLDLPYVEVAKRLDCSEGTARIRVMRGLAKLRTQMEGA